MHTTDTPLHRTHSYRRAARWMGCAGTALCLAWAVSTNAAPGDGSQGNGNGIGTQGPADSTLAQGAAPGSIQGQNGACTPDSPSDQSIVGKSLAQAKSMLQGCPWRIGMQDGKALPTTRDYRPDRRTLTIENDKVTRVTRG